MHAKVLDDRRGVKNKNNNTAPGIMMIYYRRKSSKHVL